jgi:site-specific recombinase XerD
MAYPMNEPYAGLFDEFLSFLRPRVSEQGYAALAGRTRRMLAWFAERDIDPLAVTMLDASAYQSALADRATRTGEPVSTGTLHNYLKAARSFFGFLSATGRIGTNPFLELRYPRLPERLSRNVLSEAQMGRLLAELARFDELPTRGERLRRYRAHVVAEFLYASGLRIAEACSLSEGNLDLRARLVYVPRGKGGKPHTAFLGTYASEVMERYLARGRALVLGRYPRKHGDTLFGSDKARVAAVVNKELALVCRALEVPVVTTHGFRHSLGTHLLRAGCDMRHIQAILGHEALQTTQVYTRVDKDDLKRSLDEHHPRRWARASAQASRSAS